MGTVAYLAAIAGAGWLLGADAAFGVPMPANISQIKTVNIFQEETESTPCQGPSVGLKEYSR